MIRTFGLCLVAVVALATAASAGDLSTNADIFEDVGFFRGLTTQLDVSARAAGMGGAATAVPWGDLDHWANPALLGDAHGLRYVHGTTRWPVGDVSFTSDVVQAGRRGLGVVLSGEPLDAGGATLDIGILEDAPFVDHVRGWGAGMRVLEALGNVVPSAARWSRTVDVSVGYMHKNNFADEFPDVSVHTHDWGAIAQVTPLDGYRDGGRTAAIGVAAGYCDINASGRSDDELALPVSHQRRTGVAARFAVGRAPVIRPFGAALTPLVTVIASYDHADRGQGGNFYGHSDGGGAELTFMNVVALRAGRYGDDWTYGWGLALPFGALGGISYDEARWPIADGFDPLHRRQFAVWLDPFAVWHAASGEEQSRVTR